MPYFQDEDNFEPPRAARYVCDGYRSVVEYSFADAAMTFAKREARRLHGSRGDVWHTLRWEHTSAENRRIAIATIGHHVRNANGLASPKELRLYITEVVSP